MHHPGYLYPNFILSFENPISPYLWNQPESRLPRLHRLSLMTTTAVILRNCLHKRLPEADYKRAKLISTPLKVILSWQVAQKSDEHQSFISNGINRPTNTEVTILSEFKSTYIYICRCLRTHERNYSIQRASRAANSCLCICPGVSLN